MTQTKVAFDSENVELLVSIKIDDFSHFSKEDYYGNDDGLACSKYKGSTNSITHLIIDFHYRLSTAS